ncbi:unnamed protein product [Brassica oleracea var. botrytis]
MMAQKDSSDDLQLVVSLDMNLGFSTVHVYDVDDGTASDSDRAASNDPFFLVSNWKGSRKATKA